jgi:RNA polymerase sigma-70 factor (ECF subfamily)
MKKEASPQYPTAMAPALDLKVLYEQEADTVFSFFTRFGLRSAEVEDAVHDTFMAALGRAGSFDPSRPARPWLLGIAFRIAVARIRHGRSREQPGEVPESADPSQDPEKALVLRQAQNLAQRALSQLPEEQRSVFVLHDLQEVPMGDIATAMDAPLATTYSRLRLARLAFGRGVEELRQAGGAA